MDRYGPSARDLDSDDAYEYDYPRRSRPLDSDDDSDRGYSRGNMMHGRSGRHHRPGSFDDEDSDFGRYDRPTHRGLPSGHGRGSYASDASDEEREYEPRDRYRGVAGRVARPRRGSTSVSPRTHDDSDNDSELEHGGRGIRGRGSRRGAGSRYPDRRFNGAYSDDDDSDIEPRTTRLERSRPLNRGYSDNDSDIEPRTTRLEPSRSLNGVYSDDDSDIEPSRAGHGGRGLESRRRRPFTGDQSEDDSDLGESRQGYTMDTRGGMHPRRRGLGDLSDHDVDDSEGEGMWRRRGAVSFGRPSRY